MFVGDYTGKIDGKGRLLIPAQLRKNCVGVEGFVVKKSFYSNSLELFPFEAWKKEVEEIKAKINRRNPQEGALLREIYRGIVEVAFDSAGRVLLPKHLLDKVKIEKSVAVVGVDDRIEIWDEGEYERAAFSQEELEKLLAEKLG